eukprot:TRINITY_DN5460_c0_g1_i1.p1 TRINITY_DN5460_c0_g1~~TRINITY_DN5460_c0_g1_i1.p1  ORF type:complete len:661 (-),score=263.92 TRINITY_DN5460_c0_g1_i1:205-2187(-)
MSGLPPPRAFPGRPVGTAAGLPPMSRVPGTAAGGGMGVRPPSSRRMGTAGQQAGVGVALHRQMRVTDRPVTREGMRVLHSSAGGTGEGMTRHVRDSSYYLGQVRSKMSELTSEVKRLRGEDDQIQKDNELFSHFQRRYDGLEREVSALRKEMADYNMTVEKLGLGESVEQVRAECEEIERINTERRKELDDLVRQKTEKEARIAEVESKILALQDRIESRLMHAPEERAMYQSLREEQRELDAELLAKEEELGLLQDSVAQKKSEMGGNDLLLRIVTLLEKKDEYEMRLRDYSAEEDEEVEGEGEVEGVSGKRRMGGGGKQTIAPPPPPADEKAELLRLVREENEKIQELQAEIADIQEEVEAYEDDDGGGEVDGEVDGEKRGGFGSPARTTTTTGFSASGSGSGSSDAPGLTKQQEKFKEVIERDMKMAEFISKGFEEEKEKAVSEMRKIQDSVVVSLEHISRSLLQQKHVPSAAEYSDMKKDLEFKSRQMEFAKTTHDRLREELQQRRMEIDKMGALDIKIHKEVSALRERIDSMRKEMETFDDIDGARAEMSDRKEESAAERKRLESTVQHLKGVVQKMGRAYDQRKEMLHSDPVHQKLAHLEKKIGFSEQNIFPLREYVESKGEEANYAPVKKEVGRLVDRAHAKLVQMHMQQSTL